VLQYLTKSHYRSTQFERDLLREWVRSGIAAVRKRGVPFGRRPGQRVKADRYAAKVLKLVGEGQSYQGHRQARIAPPNHLHGLRRQVISCTKRLEPYGSSSFLLKNTTTPSLSLATKVSSAAPLKANTGEPQVAVL